MAGAAPWRVRALPHNAERHAIVVHAPTPLRARRCRGRGREGDEMLHRSSLARNSSVAQGRRRRRRLPRGGANGPRTAKVTYKHCLGMQCGSRPEAPSPQAKLEQDRGTLPSPRPAHKRPAKEAINASRPELWPNMHKQTSNGKRAHGPAANRARRCLHLWLEYRRAPQRRLRSRRLVDMLSHFLRHLVNT